MLDLEEVHEDPLAEPLADPLTANALEDTMLEEPPITGGSFPVRIVSVSKMATVEDLRSFFAFCGGVNSVELNAMDDSETFQEGLVVFSTVSAAETALLLNQAMIVEKPITIASVAAVDSGQILDGEDDESDFALPGAMPEGYRPPPSASEASDASSKLKALFALLAAGYELGQQAIDFIAATEAAQKAAAAARQAAAMMAATALDLDQRHRITHNVRAFDEEHSISERAAVVSERASAAWESAVETATPSKPTGSIKPSRLPHLVARVLARRAAATLTTQRFDLVQISCQWRRKRGNVSTRRWRQQRR